VRVLLVAFVTVVGWPAEAGAIERRLDFRAARQLDMRAITEEVRRLAVATYPGQTVGGVRCPRKAPRRAGFEIFCYVDVATQVVPIRVTQLDNLGRVKLDVTASVLTKAQLEQLVAANSTLPGTVDCGPSLLIVAYPAQMLFCRVTFGDGSTQTVQLTVRDTAGTVVISGVS
jgi:hypothetical protein